MYQSWRKTYSGVRQSSAGFVAIAGGGGGDFVTDSFTDTDSTVLSSHIGETGGAWTQHPNYTTAQITILTNKAVKDANTGTACYYASGIPPSADYTVEAVLVDDANVNLSSAACIRLQTGSDSMIMMRRQNSTTMQLIKIVAGTATSIDTEPVTFNAGQSRTLKVAATGTTVEWFLDGVSLGSFTVSDTEVSGAGRVGVRQTGSWSAGLGYGISSIRAF